MGGSCTTEESFLLNDFQTPHHVEKGLPEGHAPLYRYLTIPIVVENRIVGVIAVAIKRPITTSRTAGN